MKKVLAKKSISKMIKTMIVIFLSSIVGLQILMFYTFDFDRIPDIMRVILIILAILIIFSTIQFVIQLLVPQIIMEYDDEGIYIHRISKSETFIRFKDMTNVKATINIWAKPFVVYTAVVVSTDKDDYIIRHVDKMDDVKDIISHLAFEKNEE